MKNHILLTGASGMLGEHILYQILLNNFEVSIISRNVKYKRKNVNIIHGDLSHPDVFDQVTDDIDIIIHCAGEKQNVELFQASNIDATLNIVLFSNKINVQKFIHVSSVGVIGKSSDKIMNEQTPCCPQNAYEKTKLAAEEVVFNKCEASEVYILRPTNVFNKERLENICNMNWARYALKANEKTNLVDVRNVSSAVLFAVKRTLEDKIYIISSDDTENYTYKALLTQIFKQNRTAVRLPIILAHILRILKNRQSNMGNKTYSSLKLLNEGFNYPHNFKSFPQDIDE